MGMSIVVYTGNDENENYVLRAFAEGCGGTLADLDSYKPSEVAVVFGTYKKHVPVSYRRGHVVHRQLNQGLNVVIIETGYINRGNGKDNHYAAGLNGINGRAKFNNQDSPAERLMKLGVKIEPWRKDGDHILICGQVPWDASVDHLNFIRWANETVFEIQRSGCNRRLVYRPHPLAYTPTPEGCELSQNASLEDDLKNCWAVVTCNSNSAVEAAIRGIPVIATDAGSMAMPIANPVCDVEAPKTPDRWQWLCNLAYAQWTPEEMRNEEAWQALSPLIWTP